MGRVTPIGIDNDLAPGQSAVARGSADDEAPGGIDIVLGVLIQQLRRDHLPDDLVDHALTDGLLADFGGVLGGNDHRIHAANLAVLVIFHRDLALSVGTQPGESAVFADLGQPQRQTVGIGDGGGHVLRGLVAGKAEHHTLVSGAGVALIGLAGLGFQ